MKLLQVDQEPSKGVADFDGVQVQIDLSLLEEYKIGDYLIVHAGFAIERLSQQEAYEQIEILKTAANYQTQEASKPSS